MEKNLRLIVIDELGDSYCFEAFRVPEAETLTRDEVEAFKSVLFSRVSDRIPTESNGWYWIEDFDLRCEKQARFDAELARYIEECDGDEEEAYLMLCDDIDNAIRGW